MKRKYPQARTAATKLGQEGPTEGQPGSGCASSAAHYTRSSTTYWPPATSDGRTPHPWPVAKSFLHSAAMCTRASSERRALRRVLKSQYLTSYRLS